MFKSLATFLWTMALLIVAPASLAQQTALPPIIRIVVPFSAGASTDVIARALARQLGTRLGANVIIDNRPGASGLIGAAAVAKGPRDGSILLLSSTSMITAAATMRSVAIDVNSDLMPVAMIGETPLIFAVASNSKLRTPADLINAARANPDTVTNGTSGVGSLPHLAGELLNDAAKIQLKEVPYKGSAPAVTDLLGGNIDLMIGVNSTVAGQIQAGKIRLIGVATRDPSPAFPGVPTIASVVPGYAASVWVAMFAPKGTPPAIVQRLNHELNEVATSKELREIMQADGGTTLAVSPDETARQVRDTYAAWKKLAVAKNIVAE